MSVEDDLRGLVERFNRRVERTPAIAEELAGLVRTIAIDLAESGSYAVDLVDAHLGNLRPEKAPNAQLTIRTDERTFGELLRKELGPMKAIVTRRLAIDGSLEDKLLLRRLL